MTSPSGYELFLECGFVILKYPNGEREKLGLAFDRQGCSDGEVVTFFRNGCVVMAILLSKFKTWLIPSETKVKYPFSEITNSTLEEVLPDLEVVNGLFLSLNN
ncbi:hypothetical protein C4569_02935 [Candidatus Parcubacteria bacterium]|nr:MAG: hypothetical protein C4569_02935 [Candidatus Parcubacteria bacterium]